MSNFGFMPKVFRDIADAATKAEAQIIGDARAACFHARFALEAAVHWLYRHDADLRMPYDHGLGALLHDPSFQNILPQSIFQKARLIQKQGNQAVHNNRPVRQYDALQVVKELHHVCYWLTRIYAPEAGVGEVVWSDEVIPRPIRSDDVVPRKQLEALEKQLAAQNAAALKHQAERDEVDAELQRLRQQLAEARAVRQTEADPHDYGEAQTRQLHIDVDLRRAGWPLDQKRDREYEVAGMPNNQGVGYVDYVLWGDDGKPLAVVEAKKATADAAVGRQQAKLYADCLEQMHGRRPVIFYTNGYTTWLWDDVTYPPRQVAGFYKKDELERLILRRSQAQVLDVAKVKDAIVERYYQKRAIGSIFKQFTDARRKALLVMATGTGKTRTAIALADVLQRAGWVKRALFLADRVSLVNQATGAFKTHLPESSPVNLVTEKDETGRVYVCTYPTMLNLIDQTQGKEATFGVGHFDLIIIDEAHRSVYQKFGEIFRYFDALLVGLTATPREQVDKNTYELFDLEPGVPTDAYELATAVADGFLVPPRVQQVDLKFPREGIKYDQLSEEEKAQWESLDWGDDGDGDGVPDRVNSAAVNSWLYNKDTVDKVLKHLMEHGHKVAGGDQLAKTIIFARNHDHAVFIEERFNHHYPHHKGQFARVIDNYATYAQSLIDDFSNKDKSPHIAISVDMLDTGIDVPEVTNLVFFKPVYSNIKFWQMIGRGTRLCPNLFGPEQDKADFRVFDFCYNFDFFNENPDGIESTDTAPLSVRLFRARVQLIGHLQIDAEMSPQLSDSLANGLHREVAAMNRENFIVRMHLEAVERFQDRKAWDKLSEDDRETLIREVAALPSEAAGEEPVVTRMFDLLALRLQLAHVEGDAKAFERHRRRAVEIAMMLEARPNTLDLINKQRAYLAAMQETGFWEGIGVDGLEDMRLRLRELMTFLDKKKRTVVYTDFQDEVMGVREGEPVHMPKMTGVQYEKKVKDYLKNHLTHIVIHRLRMNESLTASDLEALEVMLAEIGEEDGQTLLSRLLARSGAPSLAYFVRSLVGLDRAAAHEAFSEFLSDRSLTPPQIRFVEMVIDQLTARGVMDAEALYEPPFSNLHDGGPDELFTSKENVIERIFEKLTSVNAKVIDATG